MEAEQLQVLEYWVKVAALVSGGSTVVYALVTGFLAYYTYRMARSADASVREMRTQFDFEHRPDVRLFVHDHHEARSGDVPPHMTLALQNVGEGMAYHPQCSPEWTEDKPREHDGLRETPELFDKVATYATGRVLRPGETHYCRVHMPDPGDEVKVVWENVVGDEKLWRRWRVARGGPPHGEWRLEPVDEAPKLRGREE